MRNRLTWTPKRRIERNVSVFKTLLRELSIIVGKPESRMTIQGSDTPSGRVRAMRCLERGSMNLIRKTRCQMDLSSERDVERAKIKKLADTILLLRQKLIAAERHIARITSDNTRWASEKTILQARLHARLHREIGSSSSVSK